MSNEPIQQFIHIQTVAPKYMYFALELLLESLRDLISPGAGSAS